MNKILLIYKTLGSKIILISLLVLLILESTGCGAPNSSLTQTPVQDGDRGFGPPARTPILVGTGGDFTESTTGAYLSEDVRTYLSRELQQDCQSRFLLNTANVATIGGWKSFYIVLDYPFLTQLKASYASIPAIEASLDHAHEGLADGPRPWTQEMIQGAQGDKVYYWNVAADIDEETGIARDITAVVIGAKALGRGDLVFWTESINSSLTGTDAVSPSLVIPLTLSPNIKKFTSNFFVSEDTHNRLEWEVENADWVKISGSGFNTPQESVSLSGSREVYNGCVAGNVFTYHLAAGSCAESVTASAVTLITRDENRGIQIFRSVPSGVTEGNTYTVEWKVNNAEEVKISGEGFRPDEVVPASGSRVITASRVAPGLATAFRDYELTAKVDSGGIGRCVSMQTRNIRVHVNAILFIFPFILDCPPLGVPDSRCSERDVSAHDLAEARTLLPQVFTGGQACQWLAGRCP